MSLLTELGVLGVDLAINMSRLTALPFAPAFQRASLELTALDAEDNVRRLW